MLIKDDALDAVRQFDGDIEDAVLLDSDSPVVENEMAEESAAPSEPSDDDAALTDITEPEQPELHEQDNTVRDTKEQHKERKSIWEMAQKDLPLKTFLSIITGEFLRNPATLSQIRYILLLAIMAVGYISNRYYAEQTVVEINHLQKDLEHQRTLALVQFTRLTGMCRQSELEHRLRQMGDTTLIVPRRPPFIIRVTSDE